MRPTSLCYLSLSLSLLQRRWKVPATRTRCNAALISISRRGKTWGGGGDTPDSARSRGRATKRRRLWTRRKGRGGIRNAIRESVKPREWLSEKSWRKGSGRGGIHTPSTQHRRKGKKLKRSWNTRTRFFFRKKIARNTSFVLVLPPPLSLSLSLSLSRGAAARKAIKCPLGTNTRGRCFPLKQAAHVPSRGSFAIVYLTGWIEQKSSANSFLRTSFDPSLSLLSSLRHALSPSPFLGLSERPVRMPRIFAPRRLEPHTPSVCGPRASEESHISRRSKRDEGGRSGRRRRRRRFFLWPVTPAF